MYLIFFPFVLLLHVSDFVLLLIAVVFIFLYFVSLRIV